MAKTHQPCPLTGDLLTWKPPEIVKRYEETRVRTASLKARVARCVSETMKDSALSREEIAKRMTAFLGEEDHEETTVTKAMLDAYASEARKDHTISAIRLIALVHATGDIRPLQMIAEMFGAAVVEEKWLSWVEVGQLGERRNITDREYQAALRNAKKATRP
ncbi:MAG: DNA transposition protein [Alphaproteobacteria bacterium]|nr:DNA transposition protein [Alphaproteobacteria bacterium]